VGEVEVRDGRQTVARGSFVTADGAPQLLAQVVPARGKLTIAGMETVRAKGQGGARVPARRFTGRERIGALFAFSGADVGAVLQVRWTRDGEVLPGSGVDLRTRSTSGEASAWLAAEGDGLPAGAYRVEVREADSGETLAALPFEVVPRP
jgi:hypothetical protein